jgi:hypothetical protein
MKVLSTETPLSHRWHVICTTKGVVGPKGSGRVNQPKQVFRVPRAHQHNFWRVLMTWTKPEAEVVAVTMEVTAYVATL